MAPSFRILIADDSSVTRRIITAALNQESDIEIVAVARDGQETVDLVRANDPDVVILDVDMPGMNGIEALRAIRETHPTLPVIMFSTLTVKGGEATLDALAAGATDYVAKPTGVGHLDKAIGYLRQEIVPRIRHWGTRYKSRPDNASRSITMARMSVKETPSLPNSGVFTLSGQKPPAAAPFGGVKRRNAPLDVLAIGSSTGGPNALAELIGSLPGDLGIPILIVQHMPPVFTQLLAERLDRSSRLRVREAVDGAVVRANEVWLAPGDFHMVVSREGTNAVLHTNKGPAENSCRPAVDVLFRSVAEVYGSNALAVVLTGMGRDGTAGAGSLSRAGAGILCQDEATSVVWGMPRSVAEAGLAEGVFGLRDLTTAIVSRVRGSQNKVPQLV